MLRRVLFLPVWCGAILLTGALLGCGGSGGLIPVSGTVSVDGQPAKKGGVQFYADAGKGNTSLDIPAGEIVDGKYELMTNGQKGAPAGAYKVVVMVATEVPPPTTGTFEMPKSLIAKRYNDKATTPLTVEVKSGAPADAYALKVSAK